MAEAEPFRPPQHMEAGAWFPDLTCLQLLSGRRSLDELKHAFPDGYTRGDDAGPLLETRFPKQRPRVWAIS